MSEYRGAYTAGAAACRANQPTSSNPYAPRRVHFLAEGPGPKQTVLARLWLAGWQAVAAKDRTRGPNS